MNLVTIYSPTGEQFELPERKAQQLLFDDWSLTPPGVEVEPESWDLFEDALDNATLPYLFQLAADDFGVNFDRRWGRERVVRELIKLHNQSASIDDEIETVFLADELDDDETVEED
jgi:hypothetical protein